MSRPRGPTTPSVLDQLDTQLQANQSILNNANALPSRAAALQIAQRRANLSAINQVKWDSLQSADEYIHTIAASRVLDRLMEMKDSTSVKIFLGKIKTSFAEAWCKSNQLYLDSMVRKINFQGTLRDARFATVLTRGLLEIAARAGNAEVVNQLMSKVNKSGISQDEKKEFAQILLREAAASQQVKIVQIAVANGADVNQKDRNGRTALHDAVASTVSNLKQKKAQSATIMMLMAEDKKYGATLQRDRNGRTPLYDAVMQGHADLVGVDARLLEKSTKADINKKHDEQQDTLLHLAVKQYDKHKGKNTKEDILKIINRFLQDPRTNLKQKNADGLTPIALAAQIAARSADKALLQAIIDNVGPKNSKGVERTLPQTMKIQLARIKKMEKAIQKLPAAEVPAKDAYLKHLAQERQLCKEAMEKKQQTATPNEAEKRAGLRQRHDANRSESSFTASAPPTKEVDTPAPRSPSRRSL